MWSTGLAVMTARDNSIVDNEDGTDRRIRTCLSDGSPRFVQSRAHKTLVIFGWHPGNEYAAQSFGAHPISESTWRIVPVALLKAHPYGNQDRNQN